MVLAALIAVNAILAALLYFYLFPQTVKNERDLRAMRGQVATLQRDINTAVETVDQIDEQKAVFEEYDCQDAVFTSESQGRVGTRTSSRVRAAPRRLIEEM